MWNYNIDADIFKYIFEFFSVAYTHKKNRTFEGINTFPDFFLLNLRCQERVIDHACSKTFLFNQNSTSSHPFDMSNSPLYIYFPYVHCYIFILYNVHLTVASFDVKFKACFTIKIS